MREKNRAWTGTERKQSLSKDRKKTNCINIRCLYCVVLFFLCLFIIVDKKRVFLTNVSGTFFKHFKSNHYFF